MPCPCNDAVVPGPTFRVSTLACLNTTFRKRRLTFKMQCKIPCCLFPFNDKLK